MTPDSESVFNGEFPRPVWAAIAVLAVAWMACPSELVSAEVDLNREARRILSDNCFRCHGPDAKERKGGKDGLRLDTLEGATADLGGHRAVVPGQLEKSDLIRRITTTDADDLMPPADSGKKLSASDIALLRRWVAEGASYSAHWSYVKPQRPAAPKVSHSGWPRNAVDYFILARLEKDRLAPAPEGDRYALIRRAALDLTGLPPTLEEVDQFMAEDSSDAYERMIDRLLNRATFGEHWARLWLDQARYADSSGYADDPMRTIWGYRDYVIQALNANKPFDQFTLEQIAGDLLPDPTEEQSLATAFHRNTLTNNEGGTSDEEFRNVAIVDRVNTTMAVWMGTTMACAQCHDHKYDPISQKDYFRLFAILNNTEDADRKDETPILSIYSKEQKRQKREWETEIARLQKIVTTTTPELVKSQAEWEKMFVTDVPWNVLKIGDLTSQAGALVTSSEGAFLVARSNKTDVYTFTAPLTQDITITGLRLEALPDDSLPAKGPGYAAGNFVVSRVNATLLPPAETPVPARFLRLELSGKSRFLSLAEVEIFSKATNIATRGEARQSSTAYGADAKRAIDGNTNGDFDAKSTTHSEQSDNPWWEVDLHSLQPIGRIAIWNRTDHDLQSRLKDFRVELLNEQREVVWQEVVTEAPDPSATFSLNGERPLHFRNAYASHAQEGFEAANILGNKAPKDKGWAIAPEFGRSHELSLIPGRRLDAPAGSRLTVTVEQLSKLDFHTLGKLRFSVSEDPRAAEYARTPPGILALLQADGDQRTDEQARKLATYYLTVAPELKVERTQLATLKRQLKEMLPYTTIPVLHELAADKRRRTHVQLRGNFLALGDEVAPGLPSTFHQLPETNGADRLALARWLVDETNPLTARVVVNRIWESIFGIGLVRTSEEFGVQGEPPSHPELLDWLATELMHNGWDTKHIIRLLATSAAYRQSSRVTPELLSVDPDNRLVARGPRLRLPAETIRDQAMFVSGLLSTKLYGPPVNPPQPKMGLTAAFGTGIDWETSAGEDRYRRALYTTWRRSNPYPSMTTFDAPSREVCTVRRERSNTPLQALVTLNDPVYFEAAQALGRRIAAHSSGATAAEKARYGFRLCLARPPSDAELAGLVKLYETTAQRFSSEPENARAVATKPIGPAPEGTDIVELASWTLVSNVLLNLDEMLMRR